VHFDVAGFEDSADLDSKRLTALIALVYTYASTFALHLANALSALAARADRTFRPYARFNELISSFFVMKMGFVQVAHRLSPNYVHFVLNQGGYVKYNIAKKKGAWAPFAKIVADYLP